jgi:hypothetical protein
MISIDEVTFAGERGLEICADLQAVSAGLMHVRDAVPELTRRPDGLLSLRVSNATIDVIAGLADVVEQGGSTPDPDPAEAG